jgi:hypothetical protein
VRRSLLSMIPGSVVLVLCLAVFWPAAAAAELSFSFGVTEKYEDNVIGLTADNPNIAGGPRGGVTAGGMRLKGGMTGVPGSGGAAAGGGAQKQGDLSTSFYADIGSDHDVTGATSLLFLLSAEHTAYSTLSQFDFTIGTLSAGIRHRFSETFSGTFALNASLKDFQGSDRDGTAFGASAGLKEDLSDSFWLKQTIDIEYSTATTSVFAYSGGSAGIHGGYDLSDNQQLWIGYSYLVRNYQNSTPADKLTSQVASASWSLDLSEDWYVMARYDHEVDRLQVSGTSATNNIYSIGLYYQY